jgi:hypothetical protein
MSSTVKRMAELVSCMAEARRVAWHLYVQIFPTPSVASLAHASQPPAPLSYVT